MVEVNVEERLEPIDVSLDIKIDIANYDDLVRDNAGVVAGLFSRFDRVRKRVDTVVREQTADALKEGLAARLRDEVLAGIEDGVRTAVADELKRQLREGKVESDVKVSVKAC